MTEEQEQFIVIANPVSVFKSTWKDSYNEVTGLSEDDFYKMFEGAAQKYGLSVELKLADYIVLKGPKSSMPLLERQYGDHFAYATFSEADYEQFVDAIVNYMVSGESEPLETLDKERECFVVIANHTTVFRDTLDQSYNKATGFSDDDFYQIFEDAAQRHGATVEFEGSDYVVLKGSETLMSVLEREYGDHFSYAKLGKSAYAAFKATIDEHMLNEEPGPPKAKPTGFS